jgi:hypothetical protein
MTEPAKFISPGATLDFAFDFGDPADSWLQSGESISAHEVTVEGGLVKVSDSVAGSVVTAWVSAPDDLAPNTKVSIRFEVTTNSTPARTDARYWPLTVQRRTAEA